MKINEFDKQVTQADIDQLEVFADKVFAKVGIDVNFTRHFLDRVNDARNGKPITMSELTRLFKQQQRRWGKKIAQLGPDAEAVMKDLQTDINMPFALRWDDKNNELDLIAKTVMRKKNFKTPNPEFPVEGKTSEDVDPIDMAAAAGVSGVAGSMAGRAMGKNLAKDPLGQKPYLDRMSKLAKRKTPPKGPNSNVNSKPATGNAPRLPGVTRGAGGGGMGVSPKRVAGGARRIEPPLRNPFNMFNESGEIDNAVFEDWYNDYWKPTRDAFPNKVAGKLSNNGYDPYKKSSVKQFVKNNPEYVKSLGQDAKKYANTPDWLVKGAGKMAGFSSDQTNFAINMRNKLKKERPDVWNDVTQGNVKGALNRLGIATESLPPHLAKHFDKDGDAVKGSWKDGKWTADKKQPKKVKYTVKDVTPKGYGPVEEAKDWTDKRNWPIGLMVKHPKPEITQWYKWDGQQWVSKSAGYPVSELDPEIEPDLDKAGAYEAERLKGMPNESVNEGKLVRNMRVQHIHSGNAGTVVKGGDKAGGRVEVEWDSGETTVTSGKYLVPIKRNKSVNEDFGSVPPLAELIVMAVVAQTTVGALKAAFKAAVTTGKGIQKLNQLRKKAQGIGQGVADYVMPESLEEATREELLSQLQDKQKQRFYQAALDALHKLVSSKGGKQSVGGYAFDIARAFNGIDGRELEKMYSELHEKVNVIRQSNPLDVLDTLSTRKDNIVHPIKFYDGDVLKVSVEQARRFMNAYYKMDDDKREVVDKYIKTKNGFQQAIKSLEVRENAFDLLSAALDWKKDK